MNGHLKTSGGSYPGWILGHLQNQKTSGSLGHRIKSATIACNASERISGDSNKQETGSKTEQKDERQTGTVTWSAQVADHYKWLGSQKFIHENFKVVWVLLCQPCLKHSGQVYKYKVSQSVLKSFTLKRKLLNTKALNANYAHSI